MKEQKKKDDKKDMKKKKKDCQMNVKDTLDQMAKAMTEALTIIHERIERIEKWMILQEHKDGEVKEDA